MAKAPAKKKEAKQKSAGGVLAWVLALIFGVFALPTLILLLIGMAPTLVAYFIMDRHPSKFITRAVGYLNFAGCLPYAIDLWRGGSGFWDFENLLLIISNPFSLLVMYSSAAVGWAILFAAPPVVASYLAVTSDMKEKNLKARQKELIANWGRNVRLGSMGAAVDDIDDDEVETEAEEQAAEATPSP